MERNSQKGRKRKPTTDDSDLESDDEPKSQKKGKRDATITDKQVKT
jgi:hypothetical protein